MEKEFINYEQALELQEIGFDEPCFAYYITDEISDKKFFRFRGMEEDFRRRNSSFKTLPGLICAPLYQQAFRWVRNNYGYDVSIKKQTKTVYQFIIESKDNEDHYHFIDFPFKNYEDAELACLNQLINLVKEKI